MPLATNRSSAVEDYIARGFQLVYWPRLSDPENDWKGPRETTWPTTLYPAADYREGMQVGVKLGTEIAPGRYLMDVDFDWAPGIPHATQFLPRTGFGFGRESKTIGHAFYTTSSPVVQKKFKDVDNKQTCLVERRGTKEDGSIGFQTMLPPSIHRETGEILTLKSNKEIAHSDESIAGVTMYAVACLLGRHWPANGPDTNQHDTAAYVAGFLCQRGVDLKRIPTIVEVAATLAYDNNVRDRVQYAHDTIAKFQAGEKIAGGPKLAKEMGDKVVARLREWLPRAEDALILHPNDPLPSARAFVKRFHFVGDLLALRHQMNVFYAYQRDVSAYHERDEPAVRADLYGFLEPAKRRTGAEDGLVPFQPTKAKVENVLDALRAVCNLPKAITAPCWLQDDPGFNPIDILACRSGLLHIPTRTLLPGTPAFFALNGLDFAFDPNAPAPAHWLAFLKQLWAEDEESIQALQEWLGYLLTPDTRFQKIGMLVGPKRSGKGTIGRVLRRLLGERNVCGPTLANMSEQHGLAVLIGKTAAIIADARITARSDAAVITERLLSISGEDPLSVPRKFLPDWDGKLSVRFLILTNELPKIEDASGALSSRFIVFSLTESFFGREDHGLFERLSPELPGILNWALEGRDRLYRRGHFVQPTSANELIQEFTDLGAPEATFLHERTCRKAGATVTQKALFGEWRLWCEENGRTQMGTTQTFARSVRAVFPWIKSRQLVVDGKQERCWEGLHITPVEDCDRLTGM